MYTKEQQVRKAKKISEHELKRKEERRIMYAFGPNSKAWNDRKESIKKRVATQERVAMEIAQQKRLIRMDSINRTGRI